MFEKKQAGNIRDVRSLKLLLLTGTFLALTGLSANVQADESTQTQNDQQENAQKDAQETVLDPLIVQGASYNTEGTGSYTSNLVSVGEKDVLTVREIPQSTHVITRQKLEDGGYTSLDTALRKTPGIVVLANDDGRSSIFSRGFEYDNLYYNGLAAPLSSIYGTQPDMAIVDHVEILRGPQGLYGGTGEPTGTINMRLKQAQKEFGGSVSASAGSFDTYRADADVTGPLTENGALRGRLVAAKSESDGWVKGTDNSVDVAYGTLQADVTENTTLTFSMNYMGRDVKPFNGLPTYADGTLIDLPVDTTTGFDWNRFENDVKDYIVELEHKFNDGGHVKTSLRYADRSVDFLYGFSLDTADPDGTVDRMRWLARDFEEDSLALDAHISKPFEVMDMNANVIMGVDYRSYTSDMKQGLANINGTFNIFNWDTSAVAEPNVTYSTDQTTDSTQYGTYGQLRISPVDPFTVMAGARLSWYESEVTNNLTSVTSDKVDLDAEITPYLGLTYDLNDNFTAYGSYTSIFQPQTETKVGGEIIDPRTGNQYEIGIKGATLSNDLNGSVALFRLEDENRAVDDPDNPGSSLAQGKVRVQGFETELSGRPLPGLDVSAGYTFTMTKDMDTGTTFSYWTPKHMVQVFTKYDLGTQSTDLEGLSVGGNLKYFDDFAAISGGKTINASSYTVVDAFLNYKFTDNLTAVFNVDNVFDKKYYERVGSTMLFNFYGKPRTYGFKLKADF
jgi:outer membrane receptor for ferric coprogen and ferric-rhodotorulic acid